MQIKHLCGCNMKGKCDPKYKSSWLEANGLGRASATFKRLNRLQIEETKKSKDNSETHKDGMKPVHLQTLGGNAEEMVKRIERGQGCEK